MLMGTTGAEAQFKNLLNDAKKEVGTLTGDKGSGLTSDEIIGGLKQALQTGAEKAAARVSVTDGFFGNAVIKILMPPDAKKVEAKMRGLGMGDQVDKAILTMNRGAEDACQKAVPIFADAIRNITIEDGMSLLRGDKDAATQYLKNKTSKALYTAFLPIIRQSLEKVEATKYWSQVFGTYNEIPFVEKVNPDLPDYVTRKALDGLFHHIAEEEARIRADPAARVTDLLKKVFGS
jgi:hypothetical protein